MTACGRCLVLTVTRTPYSESDSGLEGSNGAEEAVAARVVPALQQLPGEPKL